MNWQWRTARQVAHMKSRPLPPPSDGGSEERGEAGYGHKHRVTHAASTVSGWTTEAF